MREIMSKVTNERLGFRQNMSVDSPNHFKMHAGIPKGLTIFSRSLTYPSKMIHSRHASGLGYEIVRLSRLHSN